MAQKDRTELRKTDFLVIRSQRNDEILKIVTPQSFQVGLDDSSFEKTLTIYGSAEVSKAVTAVALSGSLTTLSDGSAYLRAGSNITIESGSAGGGLALSISRSTASGFSNNALTSGDGLELDSGTTYDGSAAKTHICKYLTPYYGLSGLVWGYPGA